MALLTYGGKIVVLDIPGRKITIREKDGSMRMGIWSEHNPEVCMNMSKLQVGYFKSITGEIEDDVMKITSTGYVDKSGFPQQNHNSGGNKGGYSSGPRASPVEIARQSSLKVSADVYMRGMNGTTSDYYADLKEIIRGADILTAYVTTGKVPE